MNALFALAYLFIIAMALVGTYTFTQWGLGAIAEFSHTYSTGKARLAALKRGEL